MSKVIRFEELVPETYVNQSRDFQMLCAVLDDVYNFCKAHIDMNARLNDPFLCPSQYLPMLARKLGFDYQTVIYEDELRPILACFKRLVSQKGSYKGIKETVNLFMNIKHKYFKYSVELDNNQSIIYITIWDEVLDNLDILSDILRYILPCGYSFKYRSLTSINSLASLGFENQQAVTISIINTINNSLVSKLSPDGNGDVADIRSANITPEIDTGLAYNEGIINAFNTMQVVGNADLTQTDESEVVSDNNAIRVDAEGN